MQHQFVTDEVENSDKAWLETYCNWVVEVWSDNEWGGIWFWSIEFMNLLNMVKVFSIPYFDWAVTSYRDHAARQCRMAGLYYVILMRSDHYFERIIFQVENWKCTVAGHHAYLWVCHVDIAAGYCLVNTNFRDQLTKVWTPDFYVTLLTCTQHECLTIFKRLDGIIMKLNDLHHHSGVKIYQIYEAALGSCVNHLNFWLCIFLKCYFWISEDFSACCIV